MVAAATVGALSGCSEKSPAEGFAPFAMENVSEKYSGMPVPLETALRTLDEFLSATDMASTKSGTGRRIASVELYRESPEETKSSPDDSSGISHPGALRAAYIVNFTDSLGFAVLGATCDVPGIVAVAEEGSFSLEKDVLPAGGGLPDPIHDPTPAPPGDDSRIVKDFIYNAIGSHGPSSSSGGSSGGHSPSGGASSSSAYGTCPPLLQTNWNQGKYDDCGLWNRFCECNGHYVYAGCGTIALAQVLAYNKCPDPAFDKYYAMRIFSDPANEFWLKRNYPEKEQEMLSEFIGTIFHLLSHNYISDGGTSTAPARIKDLLVALDGYTDNTCSHADCFCDDMVDMTKNMLELRKPVIVSANYTAEHGHTWVIDGAQYSGKDYLVHCNWGWGGARNGYFHTDCFKPHEAGIYDNPYEYTEESDVEYHRFVRLITYDLQD